MWTDPVHPAGRRCFQNRTTAGSNATSATSDVGAVTLPLWVKVERRGDQFTGFYSQDGESWIISAPDPKTGTLSDSSNPVYVAMGPDVFIGLAVTGGYGGMLTLAEFSDVSFTGALAGPWQVKAIGMQQPSNDAAPLYLAVEDNAGHVKSLTHPDPAAVQTVDWQQWLIPLRNFQGVDLAAVKKMSIGVGDRENPKPGGTGTIYIDDIRRTTGP